MQVDGVLREKLQGAHIWHLATAGPDGRPHVSVVWADVRGEHILVNSALGRIKPRNIEGNPMVALSWYDPLNADHSFAIQGRVVETIVDELSRPLMVRVPVALPDVVPPVARPMATTPPVVALVPLMSR